MGPSDPLKLCEHWQYSHNFKGSEGPIATNLWAGCSPSHSCEQFGRRRLSLSAAPALPGFCGIHLDLEVIIIITM